MLDEAESFASLPRPLLQKLASGSAAQTGTASPVAALLPLEDLSAIASRIRRRSGAVLGAQDLVLAQVFSSVPLISKRSLDKERLHLRAGRLPGQKLHCYIAFDSSSRFLVKVVDIPHCIVRRRGLGTSPSEGRTRSAPPVAALSGSR